MLFKLASHIFDLFSNVDSTPLLAPVDTSVFVVSLESFQLFSALTSPLPSQSLLFSFRPFALSFHLELPTSESSHFLLYFLKAQFSSVFPQPRVSQFATQTVVWAPAASPFPGSLLEMQIF